MMSYEEMSQTNFSLNSYEVGIQLKTLSFQQIFKNKKECRQNGHQNGSLLQIYKKIFPGTGKLQGSHTKC